MEQQALVPYQADQISLIKQTVAKGVTDLELKLFLYQAQRTGLDPLSKQIHAIKRWNKSLEREEMAIQTGIDGYRLVADRSGKYAGSDDPIFEEDNEGNLVKATVTVWKLVGETKCGFSASARWKEYYPGDKQGFMWRTKPFLMLGKCAEALALRKAFPQELSGVYTHEEMQQAGEAIEIKEEPKKEVEKSVDATEKSEKEAKEEKPTSKQPTLQERKNQIFKDLQALNYSIDDMKNFALVGCGKGESKNWTKDDIELLEKGIKKLQPPERTAGEDDN